MTKFTTKVLRAAAVVFAADATAVAAHVRKALVESGLVGADAVPAEKRGRKAKSVKTLLADFAAGHELTRPMTVRLIEAGYVEAVYTATGKRGAPTVSYVLTNKGKSSVRLTAINAARKAARAAAKATVAEPAATEAVAA